MRWTTMMPGVMVALLSTGCFVDAPTAIDRICPDGENTCKCLEGDECHEGLTCMEDGRCRDPRCMDGQMGCACRDGDVCDAGLECLDKSCLVPGGNESSTGDDGVADSLTAPATSSPTEPGTSTPVTTTEPFPSSSSDDPSITDSLPSSDVSGPVTMTSTTDDTSNSDTTPTFSCHCGWDVGFSYYACGLETLAYDPDEGDAFPFDCPEGTDALYAEWMSGAAADDIPCESVMPAIAYEGCCLGNGVVAYCNGATVNFELCNEGHFNCPA